MSDELEAIVRQPVPLLKRTNRADRALEPKGAGDEVAEVVFACTGRRRRWDLLGIMQRLGEEITGSSGYMDPAFGEACNRHGIELTFDA